MSISRFSLTPYWQGSQGANTLLPERSRSLGSPLSLHWLREEGLPHYLVLKEWELQLPTWSPLTSWWEVSYYCKQWWKAWGPTWPSLLPWQGYYGNSIQDTDIGSPLGLCRHGRTVFSEVLRWSSVVLLKVFWIARLSISYLLHWLEKAGFSWKFFGLHPLAFVGWWLLQLQVWNIQGKNEIQGTHHCVLLRVLRSAATLPSFHLSGTYDVPFISSVQSFNCIWWEEQGNVHLPHFPRTRGQTSLTIIFKE